MPVEFLGIGATNDGSETHARSGPAFDKAFTLALARAHEENGWDRVLTAYASGSPDPAQAAALIATHTDRLQLLLAHRPNVSHPTFAAKTVATLDQISDGRLTLHVITGGNDHEQQREGDTLPKDQRYARTREAIQIYKKAWTSREPFDFHGEHYSFEDFVLDVEPAQQPRPLISFGGSSPAAYRVGAEEADIYALWGEPLAGTAEQIATITDLAAAAGRPAPRFQVAFRPILGRTEEEAWEKAYATVARIQDRTQGGQQLTRRHKLTDPENAGSQRLLAVAAQGERHDRALWTVTAQATGGAGNSTALVGTPETVAAALLDYYDLGVRILSARGYDMIADAREFGREVIPLVRQEVARRDAAVVPAARA
ncbi:LLM class flavin-dependent oxidoreductase [Pseudonocardia sp. KRD-184]|uniref:LLM class flavin-dependent oxidoreductase n=1 Tax=Pseudonocardia oceani TaxID=2792013 RepID=A0ABS6U4Z8_9PSEU|nr:LLM class flavin-dependent oxidoreductase [Pseudonocardia oceani]MBW0091297.1 LLM class flavin-dependent oxidoreductase [Pseudonocardia oceani]MBW0097361.1 LLM class flavin-dependent oxidoreductase [Pseudonocardia oceani]MBW0110482.1 LLM class flavin-dependent oxidoreductase [Pseudonocardia oceani]MBW0124573.1 LLM class flavin-dependent oxidoreductase [Pseudonocardia oceani]MBW0127293.1 LLM class flavin-dependent oxidoreductase [Pseudonocardia oceani]